MIIRNIKVNGIFVWDNNFTRPGTNDVEFTIGDYLICGGLLWECTNDTSKPPMITQNDGGDYYSWKHVDPTITSAEELLKNEGQARFVDTKTVNDALFGQENGVAKFLTPDDINGTYINSWGRDLSEIDHNSTYVVSIEGSNITDIPPGLNIEGVAIVNTIFVKGQSISTQDFITFDNNGTIFSYSTRVNPGNGYGEWVTQYLKNQNNINLNNFYTISKLFRKLLKYHEQNAEKYSLVFEGETTELDPGYDNLPMYNLQVQVKHTITIDNVTKTAYKWVTIFKSDLDDSTKFIMTFDSFANSNCELYLENRILKVNNGTITKLVKFIGHGTESSDGTDYYRFGYRSN